MNTLVRYLFGSIRHPDSRTLGFISMGLGIEARASRFAEAWSIHDRQCHEVQKRWVERVCQEGRSQAFQRIVVVGAGRLRDFSAEPFAPYAKVLDCIDADPLSRRAWIKFSRSRPALQLVPRIIETTGVLGLWKTWWQNVCKSSDLDDSLKLLQSKLLSECPIPKRSPLEQALEDSQIPAEQTAVLSLNILSQIPVMWQDIVWRELVARYGSAVISEREEDWVRAIIPSARALVRQHLQDLLQSKVSTICVLSDLEYLSFPERFVVGSAKQSPYILPVEWCSSENGDGDGQWKRCASAAESSLGSGEKVGTSSQGFAASCQRLDALYDTPIANKKFRAEICAGRKHTAMGEWTWPVCPRSDGGRGMVTLHRVGAFEFS